MAGADPRRRVAREGEAAVARWYEAAGYAVLDINWRVRDGEIDVVARRHGTVVFCEVKTRRSTTFGAPIEAITARKQQQLRSLALRWLAAHDQRRVAIRFDVASVVPDGRGGWSVTVLEHAF